MPVQGGPGRDRAALAAGQARFQYRLVFGVYYRPAKRSSHPAEIASRAALIADDLAAHADFFSFGTNDLTQMGFGLSRDDTGRFLPAYVEVGVLNDDPFATLDTVGIGKLMEIAVEKGRSVKKALKLGICGEHGGDPRSIMFCHTLGLDYVSCSPYRVPVARLAAAHAALAERD